MSSCSASRILLRCDHLGRAEAPPFSCQTATCAPWRDQRVDAAIVQTCNRQAHRGVLESQVHLQQRLCKKPLEDNRILASGRTLADFIYSDTR